MAMIGRVHAFYWGELRLNLSGETSHIGSCAYHYLYIASYNVHLKKQHAISCMV